MEKLLVNGLRAWAVIMAGGSGTRFWPLSRRKHPKQLLALGLAAGQQDPSKASEPGESLLQSTVRRVQPLFPPERVVVVTSELLADQTREQLPQVPSEHILAEPVARNTAPCVGWAASWVRRRDPNAVMAVLPSDHHIGDEQNYLATVQAALDAATDGNLVTIGMRPTAPETGYGYIEMGEPLKGGAHRAKRFVEKPDKARAEHFLSAGTFLWNSGMFFFRVDSIFEAIERHLPKLGETLSKGAQAPSDGEEQTYIRNQYGELPAISIDHGVMEKADRVAVVPGAFEWSDLGSWSSAWELANKDAQGNATAEPNVVVDTAQCYVRAPAGKLVALVGVENLVVVDAGDALLIADKGRAQDVRMIVEELKKRRDEEHL